MRHSELLLCILEDRVDDEMARKYHYFGEKPFDTRAEILGLVRKVHRECQTREDVKQFFPKHRAKGQSKSSLSSKCALGIMSHFSARGSSQKSHDSSHGVHRKHRQPSWTPGGGLKIKNAGTNKIWERVVNKLVAQIMAKPMACSSLTITTRPCLRQQLDCLVLEHPDRRRRHDLQILERGTES